MEKLVLTEQEAAKALTISVRTAQRWRVEGVGPKFIKLGKKVGYTEADLREYIERGRRSSTSDAA